MLTTLILATMLQTGTPALEPVKLTVQLDKKGADVSPRLFGVFFEEINHAGDGGIYAELICNGSFENNDPLQAWSFVNGAKGEVVTNDQGSKFNKKVLKLDLGGANAGFQNAGFWGINVQKGTTYRLSLRAKQVEGSTLSPIPWRAELVDQDGKVLAKADIAGSESIGKEWKELSISLKATGTAPKASLRIVQIASGMGPLSFYVDNVSLFPPTFKNRPNGLRSDLAKMVGDLKPSFIRFPGGCWVEGDTMQTSMRWKETIGPVADRRTLPNLWGYQSPNGLGYHEYLQMCEDLNAEALFVINCGMSHKSVIPMSEMDEFVQDALDAIEYANGDASTKWGKVRAQAGHKAPFNLRYLEIGNENGGPNYRERYLLIYNAVKAKYPDVKLIANDWGGRPAGVPIDMVDEHYYNTPQFFMFNAGMYDKYDRKGPKIYVGEYAVTQGCGNGNLLGALGEAAYMTGLERNGDIVELASYAPLFANLNHKAWNPDLIYFTSDQVFGIPSYHVQKLFSLNRIDTNVKHTIENAPSAKPVFPVGGIGVGSWGTQVEFKDIKVESGGKVVLDSPDGSKLKPELGDWSVVDGVLRQSGLEEGTRAFFNAPDWKNYTLTLKARRTGGYEGFLITVGGQDKNNWVWWNLGGWGNERNSLELCVAGGKQVVGRDSRLKLENNRWYDVKIEFSPDRIVCYLDGKKMNDAVRPVRPTVFASTGIIKKTGEVVIKIVNTDSQAKEVSVELDGRTYSGSHTVLTSALPTDENTLDNPNRVSPKTKKIGVSGKSTKIACPAYSLTVLRLKASR